MSAHGTYICIQKSPPSRAALLNPFAASTNLTRVVHTRNTLPYEYQNFTCHEHGNYSWGKDIKLELPLYITSLRELCGASTARDP